MALKLIKLYFVAVQILDQIFLHVCSKMIWWLDTQAVKCSVFMSNLKTESSSLQILVDTIEEVLDSVSHSKMQNRYLKDLNMKETTQR